MSSTHVKHARRSERRSMLALGVLSLTLAGGCRDFGDDGQQPQVRNLTFAAPTALVSAEVDAVVAATAAATDSPNMAIAVVDRVGNILRLYLRDISLALGANPDVGMLTDDQRRQLDFATSIARASAYLSHSQAPLTSRTGQFLNTFHFPAQFATNDFLTTPPFAFPADLPNHNGTVPPQRTIGVNNTPQAPLWQIDASNRGTTLGVPGIPDLVNPDGTTPSPGLGPLPGGIPLYKTSAAADVPRRHVGAVGVFITDGMGTPMPDLAEFAAFQGSQAQNPLIPTETFAFGPVPPEGAVFLVGILLPFIFTDAPAGANFNGAFDANDEVVSAGVVLANGVADPPEGFLVGPVASADGGLVPLTAAEVNAIVLGCQTASRATKAAIRFPPDSACKMWISITDRNGALLAVFREEDATLFSLEISVTKARNATFFSDPTSTWPVSAAAGVLGGLHPLTGFRANLDANGNFLPLVDADGNLISANGTIVNIFPPAVLTTTGVAITARTLGFLSQPFFPPGLEASNVDGPLNFLTQKNRVPGSFETQGFATLPAGNVSGIIFFPGSAPLYKPNPTPGMPPVLVGGIGVSGDGVEQDDFVTALGIALAEQALGISLQPTPAMRADAFAFEGSGIPYFKFPQNPGG